MQNLEVQNGVVVGEGVLDAEQERPESEVTNGVSSTPPVLIVVMVSLFYH